MQLDLSNDLLLVDGLQPVAVRLVGEAFDRRVEHALRRDVSIREVAASNGDYRLGDTRWHLMADELCKPPVLGSTVTDGTGTVWTVIGDVGRHTFDTRWACTCRAIEISEGLSQTITIDRMRLGKGTHGEQTIDGWVPVYTNLRAKIQPQQTDVVEEHSRRLVRITHTVYVATQVELKEKDRVRCGSKTYSVATVRNAERIDRLTEIDVVEDPWPI